MEPKITDSAMRDALRDEKIAILSDDLEGSLAAMNFYASIAAVALEFIADAQQRGAFILYLDSRRAAQPESHDWSGILRHFVNGYVHS